MSNTSATGGILTPTSPNQNLEGAALLDFIHDWISGITGLAGQFVRPRWQREPASVPNETTDWVAFGIVRINSDTFAAETHVDNAPPYNTIRRHRVLTFLVSCYGPNADQTAQTLSDGMQVAQNHEQLSLRSLGLVNCNEAHPVPELVKDKWYYRIDMQFQIKQQIIRNYQVLNLQSAEIVVHNEHYDTNITVNP